MMRISSLWPLVAVALLLSIFIGCGIDFESPNSATEGEVLSTRGGLYGLAIGLQQYYAANALSSVILTPGTTTREVAVNTTLANLVELEAGGTPLLNNNGNTVGLWSGLYRVITMADQVMAGSTSVPLDAGTQSGIMALALWHKAAALGFLAQSFEQLPLDVQMDGTAGFKTRAEAFTEAIRLLDQAIQIVTATPTSSDFKTKVLGSGFNLENSLQAYRARYSLLSGRYQEAITFSNAVDPKVKSTFSFTTLTPNPIYQAVSVSKSYAPRDSFGITIAEPNDQRLGFYLIPDPTKSRPNNYSIDKLAGFWASPTQSIPVYLPSEMNLIRAEAYVRLGNLASATTEINAVRTKKASADAFGIGASLPAYSGPAPTDALLTEIYRQRCSELFLNGLRLDDSRRLNRPAPPANMVERNRNFYPYPLQERLNNPNVPTDPAI
jgi:hypothetical protein